MQYPLYSKVYLALSKKTSQNMQCCRPSDWSRDPRPGWPPCLPDMNPGGGTLLGKGVPGFICTMINQRSPISRPFENYFYPQNPYDIAYKIAKIFKNSYKWLNLYKLHQAISTQARHALEWNSTHQRGRHNIYQAASASEMMLTKKSSTWQCQRVSFTSPQDHT